MSTRDEEDLLVLQLRVLFILCAIAAFVLGIAAGQVFL